MNPGVAGIGTASLLADIGHEIPSALLPSLLTSLGARAAALGLIEGISDGLAGVGRLVGGAAADDPQRRRSAAVGGYTTTAVLSSLIGLSTNVWLAGVLRAGAWFARGLRESGQPRHQDGISTTHPGRGYVGLEWQRSLSSAILRGVGCDARRVAAAASTHLDRRPAPTAR
jgi:hypothetical protein